MKFTKSKTARRVKVRRPKVSKSKVLKKVIKAEFDKRIEKKDVQYGNTSTALCNNGNGAVIQSYTLDLTQGVDEQTRIGNEVRMTSFIVKGHCNVLVSGFAGNTTRNPATVRLVLCKVKQQITAPTPGQLALILDNGNAGAPLTFNYISEYAEWNKDLFEIVASKKLKIGMSSAVVTNFSNNDYSAMKSFKLRVKVKKGGKKLTYQDALTPCTNHAYFLVAQYINIDGSQDVVTNFPINIYQEATMHFMDA